MDARQKIWDSAKEDIAMLMQEGLLGQALEIEASQRQSGKQIYS